MQHVSPIHDENQSPINSFIESPAISYYSTFATTPPAQERLQMALLEKQALLEVILVGDYSMVQCSMVHYTPPDPHSGAESRPQA